MHAYIKPHELCGTSHIRLCPGTERTADFSYVGEPAAAAAFPGHSAFEALGVVRGEIGKNANYYNRLFPWSLEGSLAKSTKLGGVERGEPSGDGVLC